MKACCLKYFLLKVFEYSLQKTTTIPNTKADDPNVPKLSLEIPK